MYRYWVVGDGETRIEDLWIKWCLLLVSLIPLGSVWIIDWVSTVRQLVLEWCYKCSCKWPMWKLKVEGWADVESTNGMSGRSGRLRLGIGKRHQYCHWALTDGGWTWIVNWWVALILYTVGQIITLEQPLSTETNNLVHKFDLGRHGTLIFSSQVVLLTHKKLIIEIDLVSSVSQWRGVCHWWIDLLVPHFMNWQPWARNAEFRQNGSYSTVVIGADNRVLVYNYLSSSSISTFAATEFLLEILIWQISSEILKIEAHN